MDDRVSMTRFLRRWQFLAMGLIVLSSALFVTGVVIEHAGAVRGAASSHQEATAGANTSHDADGGHDEGTPASSPRGSTAAAHGPLATATVFGLDLENPWTVGVYVLVWLGVLLALMRLGRIAWAALLVLALLSLVLACAASTAYGWASGTWPFGIVEAVWALVALRRWWITLQGVRKASSPSEA